MFEKIILTGFADEIAPELDIQMQVLEKLKMNHIEMRGVEGRSFVEYTEAEAREIKKRLDDRGFSLSAIGSPIGKIRISEKFEPHMELFRHTVELAHIMDTPNIRMFSFYGPEGGSPMAYREKVMEQLGQFADYAASNDVVLDIMKQFYGAHFKAVFDFANFVQARQDTLEAYELLKPYIAYIHVKDARWEDGSVVPAGFGDGNVELILKRLKETGYGGYLSLEPHLSEFVGFSALEKGGKPGGKLSGEEAFTLAHDSLLKLL